MPEAWQFFHPPIKEARDLHGDNFDDPDALTAVFLIRRKTINVNAWEDESQDGQFLTFWNTSRFQLLFPERSLYESRRWAESLI
jgi:hypothetical protein